MENSAWNHERRTSKGWRNSYRDRVGREPRLKLVHRDHICSGTQLETLKYKVRAGS